MPFCIGLLCSNFSLCYCKPDSTNRRLYRRSFCGTTTGFQLQKPRYVGFTCVYRSRRAVSVLLNPMIISQAKALLGVEVYLLSIVKSNFNFRGYSTKHALLMRAYSALFFFLNAVLSGLVLTNVFGEFPARVIQWGSGSKLSWVWAMWHCEFGTHPLVRLTGRVHLCQRHTLNRHGVRRAIPRIPHTASVTRHTLHVQYT